MAEITFSGLGSGMDYSTWIDALVAVKQESVTKVENKITAVETSQKTLNELKTSFSSLNTSIAKFTDSNIVSAFDIFSKKATTVSDDKVATATASNSATVQNFELTVEQLATSTIATGTNMLGKLATEDSKLTSLNNSAVKTGDIAIYVDNEKFTFNISSDTTIKDFCNFLEEKTGGTATLTDDGTLNLDLEGTTKDIKIGSSSDSSNLLDFFGFAAQKDDEGNLTGFSSIKTLTEINTTGKITSTANLGEQVTEGTFKIGNVEFTIDNNTSVSGLIYQINSNSDTGVTASYDAISNKMILKSKNPGATTINIEAGTSNFTNVVGWTTESGQLAEGSQVLGQNSKFTINGEAFEAASNTITDDISGITGLTLNLTQTTKEDESVTVNISTDLTDVEDAINTFIERYNQLVSDVKEATDSEGNLAYDSTLRSMLTEMSNTIMNIVPGLSKYISLSSVGISTGGATTNVSTVSTSLTFNKEAFEKAMADNPEEVKKLFINVDSTDSTKNGTMTKLETLIDGYLDIEKGYFAIKDDSFEAQIDTLNASLQRKQDAVDAYKTRLTKQFQNMDNYISKMQSYSSYISSIGSSSS